MDIGIQHRSVTFYRSLEHKAIAERVIRDIQTSNLWKASIVTEIVPFKAFYKAEEYHQEYYKMNLGQAYCRIVIEPKIKKFREHYKDKLK